MEYPSFLEMRIYLVLLNWQKYDENKDNVIDSKDSIWSKIKLWRDLNTDGISDITEISDMLANDIEKN